MIKQNRATENSNDLKGFFWMQTQIAGKEVLVQTCKAHLISSCRTKQQLQTPLAMQCPRWLHPWLPNRLTWYDLAWALGGNHMALLKLVVILFC